MQFIDDIMNFLKTLSFVDVVFFFAVLALMLLIIVLIYFIRENRAEEEMDFPSQGNNGTYLTSELWSHTLVYSLVCMA